jgi:hypothetical protein
VGRCDHDSHGVWVARWLAHSDRTKRLRVWVRVHADDAADRIIVWAMNDGPRPVPLNRAWSRLRGRWPRHRTYAVVDPPRSDTTLPRRLEEAERLHVSFPARQISRRLDEADVKGTVTIEAFCADPAGRRHKARAKASVATLRAEEPTAGGPGCPSRHGRGFRSSPTGMGRR